MVVEGRLEGKRRGRRIGMLDDFVVSFLDLIRKKE